MKSGSFEKDFISDGFFIVAYDYLMVQIYIIFQKKPFADVLQTRLIRNFTKFTGKHSYLEARLQLY